PPGRPRDGLGSAMTWLDALAPLAPDPVAAFRGIEAGAFLSVRREVRRRATAGATDALVAQLGALAAALGAIVERLPGPASGEPGGEEGWNVAQAIGHDASAGAGLVLAASLAASSRWPADAPVVVPGVPGERDATRAELVRKIAQSQRVIERAGRAIAGH